jgi:hypothetical protein
MIWFWIVLAALVALEALVWFGPVNEHDGPYRQKH